MVRQGMKGEWKWWCGVARLRPEMLVVVVVGVKDSCQQVDYRREEGTCQLCPKLGLDIYLHITYYCIYVHINKHTRIITRAPYELSPHPPFFQNPRANSNYYSNFISRSFSFASNNIKIGDDPSSGSLLLLVFYFCYVWVEHIWVLF